MQKSIVAKKERELTFLGLALLGTIDALASTGIPFAQILSKWGVKKIHQGKRYSAVSWAW